jgi:drug/metabolite transporter (DMT)-like permease
MLLSLLAAFAAAVAFGVAAVLQGIGVATTHDSGRVDPRLLLTLLRQPTFVASLALSGVGFSLHVTALQSLPLFLVQAVIASEVAVTALVAVRVMSVSLTRLQWGAVAAVCAGLALLASAAEPGQDTTDSPGLRTGLLVAVAVTAAVGVAVGRVGDSLGAWLLGLLGGAQFGIVALSARLLPDFRPATLVSDPAAYALVGSGLVAFLLYSTAMQRGSVTTSTAALVVTQTAVPAVVGVWLLGDSVRPGWTAAAVVGFLLALAGAFALARLELPHRGPRLTQRTERRAAPRPG